MNDTIGKIGQLSGGSVSYEKYFPPASGSATNSKGHKTTKGGHFSDVTITFTNGNMIGEINVNTVTSTKSKNIPDSRERRNAAAINQTISSQNAPNTPGIVTISKTNGAVNNIDANQKPINPLSGTWTDPELDKRKNIFSQYLGQMESDYASGMSPQDINKKYTDLLAQQNDHNSPNTSGISDDSTTSGEKC